MLDRDIRDTPLYREGENLNRVLRRPGTGFISDVAELSVRGNRAVFSGSLADSLDRDPTTRICLTDLESGDTRVLTLGPNTDRLPKLSPDGRQVAFLSDRRQSGDFQLHLLDPATGECRATPQIDGWVEYLHWSPDGRRILLGVAGYGADVAGAQGAATSKTAAGELPPWLPHIETGDESFRWRRAWVYDLATNQVRQVSPQDCNVWEAAWCGNDAIAAIASPGPSEGLWYTAGLHLIDAQSGDSRRLYAPATQLGWPAASPSGRQVAVVEALCSDRCIVAGDLRLIDTHSGEVRRAPTRGVDITYCEWQSERHLLLAGHRNLETVVALYDREAGELEEIWRSEEMTLGGFYASLAALGEPGECAVVGEGLRRAPEIAVIRDGKYEVIKSFDPRANKELSSFATVQTVRWRAPDGLEIQGLLLQPQGPPPYPLVMMVHGGPVWHFRPYWLGRRSAATLMLLERGYAIFLPNPRGSTGRGQEFVRKVLGDMGGADTDDYLSGLDHLVQRGIADPKRLGVTGVSYGGYMSAWLITQDSRFAAAVAGSPVTNHVTEHLISNIPHFVSLFLQDTYTNPGGKYYTRSPIMYAHKAQTPTMTVCGALDRCTPPEEAVQFHNALLENGVKSVLVTYPQEGHGVRRWPAAIDYAARLVGWFEAHMGPGRKPV